MDALGQALQSDSTLKPYYAVDSGKTIYAIRANNTESFNDACTPTTDSSPATSYNNINLYAKDGDYWAGLK